MTNPIRVLLIDDHALFRSGIKLLLQRQHDFEVIGEAADGLEGIKRAKALKPDIVLLDLHMPGRCFHLKTRSRCVSEPTGSFA